MQYYEIHLKDRFPFLGENGRDPVLQVYVQDFGTRESDICFVAEVSTKVVGAVWVRDMDDYGHIQDGVPSFAISLYEDYRGYGIGTNLMKRMLQELASRGYQKASLSVQKANYAAKMYLDLGFYIENPDIINIFPKY